MDLNPPSPSPANDPGLANRMDNMDVMIAKLIQCVPSIGRKTNRNNNDNDSGDHDDDSQSSLNKKNMSDFYQGAHK